MADARTEKQKVKEITDRLEEGLKELFEGEKYKSYSLSRCNALTQPTLPGIRHGRRILSAM